MWKCVLIVSGCFICISFGGSSPGLAPPLALALAPALSLAPALAPDTPLIQDRIEMGGDDLRGGGLSFLKVRFYKTVSAYSRAWLRTCEHPKNIPAKNPTASEHLAGSSCGLDMHGEARLLVRKLLSAGRLAPESA